VKLRREIFLDHDIDLPAEQLAQLDPDLAQIEQRELTAARDRDHDVDIAVRSSLPTGKRTEEPEPGNAERRSSA